MSNNTPPLDFEKAWQGKLKTGLDQYLAPKERDRILAGGEHLTMESAAKDKIIWSCKMLERLEDIEDLAALAEMRKRPLELRTLEEFLEDYTPSA